MKRDMDLIRKLVITIEDHPSGFAPSELKIEGHTEEEVSYHLWLMLQAGLIEGEDITYGGCNSPIAMATSLSWAGHEFASLARSDTVWNQAKTKIKDTVGSVSLAIFTELLKSIGKSIIGM